MIFWEILFSNSVTQIWSQVGIRVNTQFTYNSVTHFYPHSLPLLIHFLHSRTQFHSFIQSSHPFIFSFAPLDLSLNSIYPIHTHSVLFSSRSIPLYLLTHSLCQVLAHLHVSLTHSLHSLCQSHALFNHFVHSLLKLTSVICYSYTFTHSLDPITHTFTTFSYSFNHSLRSLPLFAYFLSFRPISPSISPPISPFQLSLSL